MDRADQYRAYECGPDWLDALRRFGGFEAVEILEIGNDSGANPCCVRFRKRSESHWKPAPHEFQIKFERRVPGTGQPGRSFSVELRDLVPQQIPDVSFGFPAETITETILQTNSPLKFLVPTDSSLDELWPLREYDDSSWANGFNGIGFDLNNPGPGGWTNSILEQHPLLYFRFEEPNGTTATNQGTLGAAQNATYIAGTLLNQTGLRPPEADGLPSTNMAIRFDGKDDYVSTRTPTLSNLGSFTMVAWVRPSVLTKSRVGLWGQHDAIEVGFIDPTLLQVSTAGGVCVGKLPFPSQ